MMNLESLQTILGADNVSTAVEHRLAYSRDASRLEGECLAVVFPAHPEHVVALVEWARDEKCDLVPRGAGTGLCGGATPQSSVVVDLARLSAMQFDSERNRAQVGAGVVLETLNRRLAPHNLLLPVVPGSHRAASIGGMIATTWGQIVKAALLLGLFAVLKTSDAALFNDRAAALNGVILQMFNHGTVTAMLFLLAADSGATEKARMRPKRMRTPKMPEKPPRSRTWNQCALTFTMATAPKLWKYMFIM